MSALLKLIATAAIATAIASPSNAGSWIKVERPCGSKCGPPPQLVPFRQTSAEMPPVPTYQSRSQTVIRSSYGTSVINSTYRSYSR